MKAVITGSTGWMGRSAIQALKNSDPNIDKNDLFLLASTSRSIIEKTLGPSQVFSLDSLDLAPKSCDYFIGLALKTRDYIEKMSASSYSKSCMSIVNNSLKLATATNPKSIILISSGVVAQYKLGQRPLDPYIEIKCYEENLYRQFCIDNRINLIILRLWAASGSMMVEPLKYAFGDLIFQALTKSEIIVQSPEFVFRRYIDATQLFEVLLKLAKGGFDGVLNSGGWDLEIGQLAELVSQNIGRKSLVRRPEINSKKADTYIPGDADFNKLAKTCRVTLYDLPKQIEMTSIAVREYIKTSKV
jgi:nucleoside-diphosphate-sugar epimerase